MKRPFYCNNKVAKCLPQDWLWDWFERTHWKNDLVVVWQNIWFSVEISANEYQTIKIVYLEHDDWLEHVMRERANVVLPISLIYKYYNTTFSKTIVFCFYQNNYNFSFLQDSAILKLISNTSDSRLFRNKNMKIFLRMLSRTIILKVHHWSHNPVINL